uniref:Uncharacterized protein n=1 Tax=Phlebotomus papatasi TaxID=29031 RepID=A0A1B0DP07_PHLPP
MDEKVVVITGANSGIGKETALDLARRNAKIYLACRNYDRCELARQEIIQATGNTKIYNRHLDLNTLDSVREFVEEFSKEEKHLDVLINNAGVLYIPHSITKDGCETTLQVNHISHFLLSHLLLGHLKRAPQGRIINVSSIAYILSRIDKDDLHLNKSFGMMRAYANSKRIECDKLTMDGKVVIITGANTGIGKETALDLARRNAKIYLACRDQKRCEEARQDIIEQTGNTKIYNRHLDLNSLKSVRDFAAQFSKEEKHLDVLINNAGVFFLPHSITKDGCETTLQTEIGRNMNIPKPLQWIMNPVFGFLFNKSVKSGAQTQIRCAVDPELATVSGKYFSDCEEVKEKKLLDPAKDNDLRDFIWKETIAMCFYCCKRYFEGGQFQKDHLKMNGKVVIITGANTVFTIFTKSVKSGAQTTIRLAVDPDLSTVSGKYFRKYIEGGQFQKDHLRMDGKVVIITGANTGIGKETALDLARRNAKIYLACRDNDRCESAREEIIQATGNTKVYNRHLDLNTLDSVREFVEEFSKEEKHLDVLINNAGVLYLPHSITKDGCERTLQVNHLSHFLLSHLLLDHLKRAPQGRIEQTLLSIVSILELLRQKSGGI